MSDCSEGGYRKPPSASRFEKGRSGNPRGRPRQAVQPRSQAQVFRGVASELIKVAGPSGTQTMSRFEAMMRTIQSLALGGNQRATRLQHQLREVFRGPTPEGDPIVFEISEDDANL